MLLTGSAAVNHRLRLRLLGAALAFLAGAGAASATECVDAYSLADRATVIEACTKALADPALSATQRARFLEYRSRVLRSARRYDEASRDLAEAFNLNPNDAGLFDARALLRHEVGGWRGWAEAWADAQRAIELEPDNVRHFLVPINIAVLSRQFATARDLIARASKADAGNLDLLAQRVLYHADRDEHGEAVGVIDQALASPRWPEFPAREYNWYGRRLPRDIGLRLHRTDLISKQFDSRQALKDVEAIAAEHPGVETRVERALFRFLAQEGAEKALSEVDTAIAIDATFHRSYYVKGRILAALGRFDEALDAFNAAIKAFAAIGDRHGHNDDYHVQRGRMFVALKRHDEAESEFIWLLHNPDLRNRLVTSMRTRGYYLEQGDPLGVTKALRDGIRACILDRGCI
jgi:tetratricopeptide (TPR) repeat protein